MARQNKRQSKRRLAVIDFETDPFKHGREPIPFASGFYDEENYVEFFGTSNCDDKDYDAKTDCVLSLISYIENLPVPYMIYAHNGGKFDFFFLLKKGVLTNPALMIHGRITKCGLLGMHELRDSYSILPVPLALFGKDEIDYKKMERDVRHKHKDEILKYMKRDHVELYNVIKKFHEQFGPKITIGATAISQLGKFHHISRQDENHDAVFDDEGNVIGGFRRFYYGGRVECFEAGEINGDFKIYDVNSMYPEAMANYDHPCGKTYLHFGEEISNKFNHQTGDISNFVGPYFMKFIGENRGALPSRIIDGKNKGGLTFNNTWGEFMACSHEIKTAIELGRLKVSKILEVYVPCSITRFDQFVKYWMAEKIAAQEAKDVVRTTFAKLMLNSAYGKFATDPRGFKDWFILDTHDIECLRAFDEWKEKNTGVQLANDMGRYEMWTVPAYDARGFYDVAIAASITSAARSMLLRAIHNSVRPLYCDTDSLICESLKNVSIHPTELGAWKYEGSTNQIFIGGKKMYSCYLYNLDGSKMLDKQGQHKLKIASKGAHLQHQDLIDICYGKTVEWSSEAPNFKLTGDVKFTTRKIVRNV